MTSRPKYIPPKVPLKDSRMSSQVHVSEEKQQRILDIIDSWKNYEVDLKHGILMRRYYHKNGDHRLRRIKHYLNEAGKPYFHIYYRRTGEDGDREVISAFHLMWLVAYGKFDPRLRLHPINGNWLDYRIENITVTHEFRKEVMERRAEGDKIFTRKVRSTEIEKIRSMMLINKELRPIDVANSLRLNYFSVQRAMDRIRRGLPLRFEGKGPYRQAKDPWRHIMPGDI